MCSKRLATILIHYHVYFLNHFRVHELTHVVKGKGILNRTVLKV